ncbi:UNVERIFIED_CONTAM: putative inactive receptor kinase [Sesamum angustifolium]|uniref:Inactive receptor kinase n=1 Tax=Sesamum angustifolium TaxID=2727405 RepID=A0AAW2LET6_9LAMI
MNNLMCQSRLHVDWGTRFKIAIGAARGIAAIHAQNSGKLVHGNIKASNIFLNPQRWGCVSDLGLATIIGKTFTPTASCYAPEVRNTQNMSQASDVYSFGILILELVTRRSPAHFPGGPMAVDLVKLVGSVRSKEKAAEVFDAELLTYPTIREQAVKMFQIGKTCVANSIKNRPKMSEVVKMLEDIIAMNPERDVSLEIYFHCFKVEEILRAPAKLLGKGVFGTSYKLILENGNTMVVKRLKDMHATFKEFQQLMGVTWRMPHENVAELRGCFFHRDEKFLVYDYYNRGNVSARLHGRIATWKPPLDWETRLKIAVGAARGITHIHRQDGGKLVHGNIKSSNIFLSRQLYGLVSDVGLTKLMNPVRRTVLQGYWPQKSKTPRESPKLLMSIALESFYLNSSLEGRLYSPQMTVRSSHLSTGLILRLVITGQLK